MTRLSAMSYFKIVLVCLLCIIICGTLMGGFSFLRHGIDSWSSSWRNEHPWTPSSSDAMGSFSVEASTIENLSINWLAGKVSVTAVPDDEVDGMIQVSESSNARVPLRWHDDQGTLEIDYGEPNRDFGCSFNQPAKDLFVKIPLSRASQIGTFELNSASGSDTLSGLSCSRLSINQASGAIDVSDFIANSASFAVASGDFSFAGDILNILEFDQASGHSTVRLLNANPGLSDLSMASGNLTLYLPSPDFNMSLTKISGSYENEFNTSLSEYSDSGQAGPFMTMDMISGSFAIKKTS